MVTEVDTPPAWAPGRGSAVLLGSALLWSAAAVFGVVTNEGAAIDLADSAAVVLAVATVVLMTMTALAVARSFSSYHPGPFAIQFALVACLLFAPLLYLSPVNFGRAAEHARLPRVAGWVVWTVLAVSVVVLFTA